MGFRSWSNSAKLYFCTVTLAGWGVFLSSLWQLGAKGIFRLDVLVLSLALALSGRLYIQLPNFDGRITPTGLIIMYAGLMEGPATAALLAGLEAILSSVKQSRDLTQRLLFNVGALPLAIWLALQCVNLVIVAEQANRLSLLERAMLLAIIYYAINMGLVLRMMLLLGGAQALQAARSALLWSWAEYLVGGIGAGLLTMVGAPLYDTLLGATILMFLTSKTIQHYFQVLRDKTQALETNRTLLRDREGLLSELKAAHLASLETLALAIEAKDPLTHGHVQRVQSVSEVLARALDLSTEEQEVLQTAALMHDIGKLAIPEYVLYQEKKQTDDDLRKYEAHASIGADILTASRMNAVVPIVHHHHERFDGTGYPDRLAGDAIPLGARVLAVADTYDKLCHPRTGDGLTHLEALEHIAQERGKGLDPKVVDTFLAYAETIYAVELKGQKARDKRAFSSEASFSNTLLKDVQSTHTEAMTLHTLVTHLRGSLDTKAIMRHMSRTILATVPCDALLILLPDERDNSLQPAWQEGILPEDMVTSTLQALSRFYKHQNTSVKIFQQPVPADGKSLYQAWMAFPMPMSNHSGGLLVLYHAIPQYYSDAQTRLIQLVVENGAPSLASAREYEKYQRASTLDELTGLGNPRTLRTSALHSLESARVAEDSCCVVMMDLNGFKAVNDTLGHQAGDLLLVNVARILQRHAQPGDELIRNGGDEFVMVLRGYSHEHVDERMANIYADACHIWPLSRERASIGTSFGLAWLQEDGDSLEALLAIADTRMYEDKRRKNGLRRMEGVRNAS